MVRYVQTFDYGYRRIDRGNPVALLLQYTYRLVGITFRLRACTQYYNMMTCGICDGHGSRVSNLFSVQDNGREFLQIPGGYP